MQQSSGDRQLVCRLIERQPAAWAEFVERYQRLVIARVTATLGECQIAADDMAIEDIAAEVFASLFVDDLAPLRRFRFECRLSTWLAVIARRVCLRELSRLKLRNGLPSGHSQNGDALAYAEAVGETLPGDSMIRREEFQHIRQSMRRLRPADQLILRLYFDHELSYREISRQAGISINSVGPKLNRAIRRLRELVGPS